MNTKYKIITTSIFVILTMMFSAAAPLLAADTSGSGGGGGPSTSGSGGGDLNPIGITDPRILIGRIINAVLGIVGSLALLSFVIGGFTWVTSAGNDEKVKKGKDMITWASLGLAVVFLGYVVVRFLIESLTSEPTASDTSYIEEQLKLAKK